MHFISKILLNFFMAYCNQQSFKHDFLNFISTVSEMSYHHGTNARVLHDEARENRQQRPTAILPLHAWVQHQSKKQISCMCYKGLQKRKDIIYHCPGYPGELGLCSMDHLTAWHRDITKTGPQEGPKAGPSGTGHRRTRDQH